MPPRGSKKRGITKKIETGSTISVYIELEEEEMFLLISNRQKELLPLFVCFFFSLNPKEELYYLR